MNTNMEKAVITEVSMPFHGLSHFYTTMANEIMGLEACVNALSRAFPFLQKIKRKENFSQWVSMPFHGLSHFYIENTFTDAEREYVSMPFHGLSHFYVYGNSEMEGAFNRVSMPFHGLSHFYKDQRLKKYARKVSMPFHGLSHFYGTLSEAA